MAPDEPRRGGARHLGAVSVLLVSATLALGVCAAGGSSESRRSRGHDYASAFSDATHNRRVAWDDHACSFVETTGEGGPSGGPGVNVRVIPMTAVGVLVRSRTARAGALDVTFYCEPPALACISHTRREGPAVIATGQLTEHTMPLAGSVGDVPRVTEELEALRAGCGAQNADAGR